MHKNATKKDQKEKRYDNLSGKFHMFLCKTKKALKKQVQIFVCAFA